MGTEIEPYDEESGQPLTTERRLQAAAGLVSDVAETTSTYTRDMQALGVSPGDAFTMLAGMLLAVCALAVLL